MGREFTQRIIGAGGLLHTRAMDDVDGMNEMDER